MISYTESSNPELDLRIAKKVQNVLEEKGIVITQHEVLTTVFAAYAKELLEDAGPDKEVVLYTDLGGSVGVSTQPVRNYTEVMTLQSE